MAAQTVVHIITRLDRGGSAQNTLLTAIGHDRSRFTPIVVAGRAGRWDDQGGDQATAENCRRLDQAGIRWHLIPSLSRAINPIKDLIALLALIRLLRHERPAVVHTHTSKAGVLGRIAAWLARAPVVVHTPHGHVFYGHFRALPSRLFLEVERTLARWTTWLIALTEAERDEHLRLGVGRAERFAAVPSGIDLDRYRHAAGAVGRRPPGFDCPPDAIVVGSVGWLTPVKGHAILIRALARLKPRHPRLHVVIVGGGSLHGDLMALADRLGLRESVRLLGERHDIPDCLAAMDLYVHPSLNEGMGRALIEAMAAGRPVVVSRVGGIPAIVTDRLTGLLVPPADPEALASAIDELLRRPDWAKELGMAASASIGPRFGIPAMVKAVETVYGQALEQTEQGPRMNRHRSQRAGWLCGWVAAMTALAASACLPQPASGEVAGAPPPGGRQPLVAAFHVHSTVSTGDLTLDQLAEQAEQRGLDAVVITDNFVLRYEYGLYPFRGFIRRTFSLPSVLDYGVGRFLADVAAVQARHPRVLLVSGIEVVPHYFWTGSLLERNLTMHNSQKNILVLGLSRVEDYAGLPVNGNPGSYRYGWSTLLNLAPAILLVPAAWLWRRRTLPAIRTEASRYRLPDRHRTSALLLAGAAILLLLHAWPLSQPVFSSYNDRLGYQPYQSFINAVRERGGATIWSMPEARDFNVYQFGRAGSVTIKTDPYPEALILTSGYTGFGGIYQDTRTVTSPGGIWDQLLGLYVKGQIPAPPFAVGEIAFHGLNRDTRELDQVVTVFQVRERTVAGIIEALWTGRLYAVGQYQKGFGLRLDGFRVECAGGTRGAESGELLDPAGARDVTVRLSVAATDRAAHPITVTVIRSGVPIARVEGTTPFAQQFADVTAPSGVWHSYRIAVESGYGADGELLSNPIFVGPIPAGEGPAGGGNLPAGR